MKKILLIVVTALTSVAFGQEVQETFNGTRVINGHSVETLESRILQFRIEHRFGDIAGTGGGVQQFFGFDQAADIRFAFEYGITDDIMVGVGRSKGTGAPYRSLVDMFAKYKILAQEKDEMPISLTAVGSATVTYMAASSDLTQVTSFPKFAHRWAYSSQLLIARKFGERISVQIMPTYVHRNYVDIDDVNGLFSVGGALSFKVTKNIGLIAEYYHNIEVNDPGVRENNTNSLAFAFEWITNGHTFKLNVTNSRGFNETQFIPYTFSKWKDGEFRLGFTISRNFKL